MLKLNSFCCSLREEMLCFIKNSSNCNWAQSTKSAPKSFVVVIPPELPGFAKRRKAPSWPLQLLVAEQERMLHDELEKDEAERLAEIVASHEEEDEGVVADYAEEDEGVVADDEVGDEQKESGLVINFGRVKFLEM
ncbi:unnamed protein product [Bursaphelenchus okinawaensis]|uniref:Uncharacterized protein n=1 Tax=Bursaphelenchus okinawaensis TaxID=465554 RepID=A0A811JRK1_9BILA|nr:unnamed protein product [Bursaphelenchus okinawaensis]CAG9079964.1 unnamed protein product [Bursaphelenchus okinawaensis]